jgi:8-oxo-dGTP pyrophosphatase MutT (NUDIX family)
MAQPTFFAAVFAIIRDDDGRILFQQRQNTGFRDGQYQLPSGHVE